MKFELKHIGYWSLIKISFVVHLIAGFAIGIIFALFIGLMLSLIANVGELGGMPLPMEELPPLGILLAMYPIMLGFGGAFFGTIFMLIIAFVYNLTAKLIGGIEVELNQMPVMVPTAVPPQAYVQSHLYHPTPPPPPPPVEPLPPDITPPPDDNEPRRQS